MLPELVQNESLAALRICPLPLSHVDIRGWGPSWHHPGKGQTPEPRSLEHDYPIHRQQNVTYCMKRIKIDTEFQNGGSGNLLSIFKYEKVS